MTERCAIRDHHGISDPEFDSPLPVFLKYPWASWCNLAYLIPPCLCFSYTRGRRGATWSESSQFDHGSGWDVSRRYPDYAERVHVVLSREGARPVSVLLLRSFARDRGPGFTRAPMPTGAPNKARGRSAQLASELKAKGREVTPSSVTLIRARGPVEPVSIDYIKQRNTLCNRSCSNKTHTPRDKVQSTQGLGRRPQHGLRITTRYPASPPTMACVQACMKMDETLYHVADKIKWWGSILHGKDFCQLFPPPNFKRSRIEFSPANARMEFPPAKKKTRMRSL